MSLRVYQNSSQSKCILILRKTAYALGVQTMSVTFGRFGDHGVEGVDNACATQDEPVIEVYQSEELA